MRVLLVGSGGREHALAWGLSQSRDCNALFCAPANAGINESAEPVDIAAEDIDGLTKFAIKEKIDLVVVGPEAPLVLGLADKLQKEGIAVFGPSKDAARLEGSKGFMKDICATYNIPTARYARFKDVAPAKEFIEELAAEKGMPIVVKADGLAAGKGVIIAETKEEALQAVDNMLEENKFGDAGAEIVVEEFLDGEELSYFALADGKSMLPLTSAQDHKRAFDGDVGPNTGGMGAYSPARLMSPELEEKILHRIIQPTIDAMASEGCPFTGVLYAGIMVIRGEPYLLEYNVRFGDPECQVLIPRLQGDLLEILNAGAHGRLDEVKGSVTWSERRAMCVVMATEGYPDNYPKNTPINDMAGAYDVDNVIVFHAGTKQSDDGKLVSIGGRVLGITALGDTLEGAKNSAYEAVDKIDWPDGFCRRDIGWRALMD